MQQEAAECADTKPAAAAAVTADGGPATAAQSAPAALKKPFTCECKVNYGSHEYAEMVMKALSVDKELRPQHVSKAFKVDGSTLIIYFEATDARTLRSAVGSLCDLMALATRTLEAFAQ